MEVSITFNTLTPLWTGDAWGDNKEIRLSSLMGSLRFWFEVICYFAGITDKSNYKDGKLKNEVNEKEFKEKIVTNGSDFEGIDKTLAQMGISLPSRVFGCTGWKGWVRIKEILNEAKNNDYKYYLGELKLDDLEYNKNGKPKIPTWYFKKGFYGIFEVIFEVEESIIEPIFYPLLTFMEEYGFWGGKWNVGYGILKVERVEEKCDVEWKEKNGWREESFSLSSTKLNFSDIIKENNSLNIDSNSFEFVKYFLDANSFFCNSERDFKNKISNIPEELRITKFDLNTDNFSSAIELLLMTKAKIRNCLRPDGSIANKKEWNAFRHELLGTTSGGTEGTKIIPRIYEENGQFKGGFVSIAGVLNLGD